MENVQVSLDEKGYGQFFIVEGNEQLATMEISVLGATLTAYHTEVSQKAEGRGLAKMLLQTMVAYAREHQLKVVPLCPFVHAQFKRHPEAFADIWQQQKDNQQNK